MRSCKAALLFAAALGLAASCGGSGAQSGEAATAAESRSFPSVAVPSYMTDLEGRAEYLAEHYWDKFLDTAAVCRDTALLNGVPKEDVEQAMGNYAYLVNRASLQVARASVLRFYRQLEAFAAAGRDTFLFHEMTGLTEKYLYDPNSPMRNEDAYQPFASGLAQSPLLSREERGRYSRIAAWALLNQTGAVAADFAFIDTEGRSRTLYGIEAEYLLLVFGNPDCTACRELVAAMGESSAIEGLVSSGRLKVADIYIDEDLRLWREHIPEYPACWINGYDPSLQIRADVLYHVRALPSLYLLDSGKRVILKDAPQERVIAFLQTLQWR